PAGLLLELDRDAEMLQAALVREHHLALQHMRVVDRLDQVVDRREADVAAAEPLLPLGQGPGPEGLAEELAHRLLDRAGALPAERDEVGPAEIGEQVLGELELGA